MDETDARFAVLREAADPRVAGAIERLVREGSDRELCRVNALAFAARHELEPEREIAGFLHAARLGIFELSWNLLFPGCGRVLRSGTTLKPADNSHFTVA